MVPWVLVVALAAARADVIFRVPEVRHAAGPKAVGTGERSVPPTGAAGAERSVSPTRVAGGEQLLEVRYEEYFVEHDVSTADARRAAAVLDPAQVSGADPSCGACSRRELEYCEARVLADHCCCERRFVREPFPWLPHTCYVGPRRCRPLAGDCAQYARLRDCCCLAAMADKWKGIMSKTSRVGISGASLLLVSMLLFVAYL